MLSPPRKLQFWCTLKMNQQSAANILLWYYDTQLPLSGELSQFLKITTAKLLMGKDFQNNNNNVCLEFSSLLL